MIEERDFIWKERKVNNIETNPLDCYYCIVDVGDCARIYSIMPQYPVDEQGLTILGEPELYIFFEDIAYKSSNEDKKDFFYKNCNYDGYLINGNKCFIRAFKTLEEAKKRAYFQYKAIYGYALSYIVDDINDATKKHFVVK